MTYTTKVYLKEGGDELVVEDGGAITIKTGGTLTNDGTSYVVTEPDDTTLEINGSDEIAVKDGGIGTDQLASGVTDLLALLSAIPVTDQEDGETVWNDNGTLKVSSPA